MYLVFLKSAIAVQVFAMLLGSKYIIDKSLLYAHFPFLHLTNNEA